MELNQVSEVKIVLNYEYQIDVERYSLNKHILLVCSAPLLF